LTSLLAQEIHDQPRVLARFRRREGERVLELGGRIGRSQPRGVLIAARGSSDHVAVYAKYVLGQRLGLPVALAAPSLVTIYQGQLHLEGWLTLAISQSGASPDVVSVIAVARDQGSQTVAITDRPDSDLGRAADQVIPLHVGGERSVAATGSFTASLYAIAHLCAGWEDGDVEAELDLVPEHVAGALECEGRVRSLAARLADAPALVIIGRGFGFPVALEWSLKLKEVAAMSAEAFSAADYRHGPIALASSGVPVLLCDTAVSAGAELEELERELGGRGVDVCRISDAEESALQVPLGPEWLAPIPAAVPGQLLALHLARARGMDPDSPKGLRKVTETF
jgi:glucosamine--fructose-6-phosphate aminotransferase (isomerizing)